MPSQAVSKGPCDIDGDALQWYSDVIRLCLSPGSGAATAAQVSNSWHYLSTSMLPCSQQYR
jgi:hypothetical protein